MSNAPVTGRHRASDDGTGHCAVCRVSVIDWGRGVQHQQGWRARQERVALREHLRHETDVALAAHLKLKVFPELTAEDKRRMAAFR